MSEGREPNTKDEAPAPSPAGRDEELKEARERRGEVDHDRVVPRPEAMERR